MQIRIAGKTILVTPESESDQEAIRKNLVRLVEAGYRVEKRTWGGFVITDPALGFKWELTEVEIDVRTILGC